MTNGPIPSQAPPRHSTASARLKVATSRMGKRTAGQIASGNSANDASSWVFSAPR